MGCLGFEADILKVEQGALWKIWLRIIVLLRSGLATFRFNFGKTEKPSFSSFSDLADVTMTPNTNYV